MGSDAAGVSVVRPIGLSPTRAAGPTGWYPAVRWPPSDLVLPRFRNPGTTEFRVEAWDPSLFGMAVLSEFVRYRNAGGQDWTALAPVAAPILLGNAIQAELNELRRLIEYRPEVLSEALAQATDIVGYWAGLLTFSRSSHPWTFRLARIAIVVGEFVAMHWKYRYRRARPSQLDPALLPPIPIPGHASYPSGHATQAYLLSGLLSGLIPRAVPIRVMPSVVTDLLPAAMNPGGGGVASLLDRMAERVARNREVLGLHYPTDSTAGKQLAENCLDILQHCPLAVAAINEAHYEWL